MNTTKKLGALFGATVLTFALFGIAVAHAGASDQGVTPTTVDGKNIAFNPGENTDQPDCAENEAVVIGNDSGSGTASATGVFVDVTYDSEDKEVSFEATGGVVLIAYIKGGNGYSVYDYSPAGVTSDGHLHAPGGDNPAGLSHAIFCTGEGEEETAPPSFEQSQETETDEPSEPPSDPPSDEPSFEQSFEAETDVPTEPPTNTIGGGTSGPADGAWLLVVALGVFLASVVVLTPARVKNR